MGPIGCPREPEEADLEGSRGLATGDLMYGRRDTIDATRRTGKANAPTMDIGKRVSGLTLPRALKNWVSK